MQHNAVDAAHPESGLAPEMPQVQDRLPITMDKRVDLALAIGVAALGAYAVWLASGFRIGNYPDPLTSRGLPYILGGFMMLGGTFLAIRRLRSWRELPGNLVVSEGTEDEGGHPASAFRAFAAMACAFLWAVLLQPAGYLIATPVSLFGMLLAMGIKTPLALAIFPPGFALLTWAIFSQFLRILLPLGPLAPLARSWGLIY